AFRAMSFAWLISTGLLAAECGTIASAICHANSSRTGSLFAIDGASARTVDRLRTVDAIAQRPPASAAQRRPATRRKNGHGRRVVNPVFRHAALASEAAREKQAVPPGRPATRAGWPCDGS